MSQFWDDVATGPVPTKLKIFGRPKKGQVEKLVISEEPTEAVQMHWLPGRQGKGPVLLGAVLRREHGVLMPHFKANCPYCQEDAEAPRSFHYQGCISMATGELGIAELTHGCFSSLVAGAQAFPDFQGGHCLRGLLVTVFRGAGSLGERVLRVQQRLLRVPEWKYDTRRELARIWGLPLKPRLYKEA